METKIDDQITLEGINSGKSFRVERLSTEGVEIIAEANQKTKGDNSVAGVNYRNRQTVLAILLSSNTLMSSLGFTEDNADYRAIIESATRRMKAEDMLMLIEKLEETNKSFLSKGRILVKPKAQELAQDSSLPPASATPSNTPPE